MKHVNLKSLSCVVFVCCATFLFCFSTQASAQEDGTSLMLEITPPQGGSLNIVPGVYSYDKFAEVTLVATPKPGYQFAYWIGNVTNATTGTTMVFLDSPKMVIAVFARNVFETVGLESDYIVGGGGGSGLTRSGSGYPGGGGGGGGGGKRQEDPHLPGHDDDIPVPVPEPVTAALFFAGVLMLAKSRRNGANITEKM